MHKEPFGYVVARHGYLLTSYPGLIEEFVSIISVISSIGFGDRNFLSIEVLQILCGFFVFQIDELYPSIFLN